MFDPFPIIPCFFAFLLGAGLCALLLLRRQKSREKRASFNTGMLTVSAFQSYAKQQAASSGAACFAIVSMEICQMPRLLSARGAAGYDDILHQASSALGAHLSGAERAAQTGEDTFCFLLQNRAPHEIRIRLDRIAQAFSRASAQGAEAPLRFGVYLPQSGEDDAPAMLRAAILARLNGPAEERCCFYDPAWETQRAALQSMASAMDEALAHRDFSIFLQPRVRALDGRVAGAEALLRWNHPHSGLLSADMFLPAAEQYGKCTAIDRFAIGEVCRLLSEWRREGRELCPVTVHLSRESLMRADLAEECAELCQKRDVSPAMIEFTFTEALLLEAGERAAVCFSALHDRGFRCAVDSFGALAASLSLLNTLMPDTIKLDRSFFSGKNNSSGGRSIVEAILKLASQLQIRTVADGVDNAAQAQYLQRAACDLLQGLYYFKPLSAERFAAEAYENGQLCCAERESTDAYRHHAPAAKTSAKSVVLFSYHPKEDHIEFSEPFSPILEGETHFDNAKALLHATELIYDNDREDFFHLLERCQRENGWVENTLRFCLSEGRYGWLEVHMHQELYGNHAVVSGTMIDIARWKREIERWKEKASRDMLTGLYNREHFEQTVQAQLAGKGYDSAALFFIDVDNFKGVNDTMGHQFGDDVLCYVAKQLLGVFRHTDMIARYGGDEFVVFAPSITWPVLEDRLTRLCGAFRFPYRSTAGEYKVSCSIGAAMFQSGDTYAALLGHADSALYEAKLRGKDGFVLYEPYMSANADAARAAR